MNQQRDSSTEVESLRHRVAELESQVARHLAEGHKLLKLNADLRRNFDDAPVGLSYLDADLRFIHINKWLAKMNDLPVEAHIGKTIGEVLPSVGDSTELQFRQVLDSGEPIVASIVEAETPAHPRLRHAYECYYNPDVDANGTVVGVRCVVFDVTQRRSLQEQLLQSQKQLKASNKQLEVRITERTEELQSLSARFEHVARVTTMGELVASIAHELNQPLTAILANAQAALGFMEAGNPDLQEVQEIIQDIVKDDVRAGEVIRRLRTLLKQRPAVRESIHLDTLIDGLLPLVRSNALAARVRIHVASAPNLPSIEADPVQLQQVVMNLLTNAIDASRLSGSDGKDVRVVLSRVRGASIMVAVRDDGQGIPAEKIGEVFNAFFTTKAEGLGMGLSICKTIIEAHGGTMSIENLVPRGCCVSFVLPLKSATAP